MTYNLDALKTKLDKFNGPINKKEKKVDGPKLQYFKPKLGETNIRFLPYKDSNGQPFQEIVYYDCKELSDRRIIAPSQFSMPDPIQDFLVELKKDRSAEAWKMVKALSPKTRYYAQVIDRDDEAKGMQVWEFSQTVCKDIYSILVNEDYRDEDMMSPETGYDFLLTTTNVLGKTFNGFQVKETKIVPRRKASKLAKTQAEMERIVGTMVNLEEHFKAYVSTAEKLQETLSAFLNADQGQSAQVADAAITTTSVAAAVDNLDEQFKSL